eukprot:CAMPEP_0113456564 /NCGR_PEP_ID=MMETSP0014_2-20120614/8953_1 /TAXON_ID=2857 /ORGANISM="Nitzschia sp." /LENGTH=272 /DNA_ID=CAMNT_0000348023 /DNA_START=148 /DNA_END=966 /DNA_ORIENTATION=+ /assembly_acc=CAM_ASM_000159
MAALTCLAMMIFLSADPASQGYAFAPSSLSTFSSSSLSSSALQMSSRSDDDSMVYYDETNIETTAKSLSSPSSRRDMLYRSLSSAGVVAGTVFVGAATPKIVSAAENKALSEEYRQGTAALADMNEETAPVPREAYKKLPSGVIYADLRPSGKSNEVVKEGSKVNLQWVLRKSNGYFVDSSETNGSVPFIFTVGDGSAIAGVDEGVRGMGVGGVRRLLIPPYLAYVQGLEDGKPGPLPVGFGPRQQMRRVQNVRKDVPGEYVFLEVQVKKIR